MSAPAPVEDIASAAGEPVADRRLHPMSWLFVLVQNLKHYILPLLAVIFIGGGDRNELWSLISVGLLVLFSLWQYFTYRYGVGGNGLVVRSGLLNRSLRVIPFVRIQNVAVHQTVLHRLFGVAEVRMESAGGKEPEAQMRVLKLADALALETLVRRRGADPAQAAEDRAESLLRLTPADVLRLGLVSNGGLVLAGAGLATVMQYGPDVSRRLTERTLRGGAHWLFGRVEGYHFDTTGYALLAVAGILAVAAALKGLSVALALLRYYGFELSEQGRRLTAERGLLARWRTTVPRRRIQAWTLEEGVLHRLLRRRRLAVDTVGADEHEEGRALKELAPIATPAVCDGLIAHLLPHARWDALHWRPLPKAVWWRLFLPDLPWTLLAAFVGYWHLGEWSLLALLWLPWAAFKAQRRARRMGYAMDAELVAVREGWWHRHWRFAEFDKLQALQITRSPLDRRCGTATLWLDTAGAGALAAPLRIRFLPVDDARALYERLAASLAKRPLRW
ncbi:PH domain-containing protein [Lysobacter sp. K5869]|uniref:PH domain-containing protein n=1 Tax=Lysobacter sp. K5869 TaxID=2820808 RepID=UPI001C0603D2|nr:PH domain-containing protein [Lysobacter sp. K5869]QWP77167.1 PH domain-containing protein [Lysobacter sp. K5869]